MQTVTAGRKMKSAQKRRLLVHLAAVARASMRSLRARDVINRDEGT